MEENDVAVELPNIRCVRQADGFYRASIDAFPGHNGIGVTASEAVKHASTAWYWHEVKTGQATTRLDPRTR